MKLGLWKCLHFYVILNKYCPRSLMDKTGTCGVSDRGSIPLEGTLLEILLIKLLLNICFSLVQIWNF